MKFERSIGRRRMLEGYGDISDTARQGLFNRIKAYAETGEIFNIKSKDGSKKLPVYIKHDSYSAEDMEGVPFSSYTLYNADTDTELGTFNEYEDVIKFTFDMQDNLDMYISDSEDYLKAVATVEKLLKMKTDPIVIPDTGYMTDVYEKFGDKGTVMTDGTYLHGDAEDDAGYDCVHIISRSGYKNHSEGVYKCFIVLPDGSYRAGMMYLWPRRTWGNHVCGLICYADDEEARTYAERKKLERAEQI